MINRVSIEVHIQDIYNEITAREQQEFIDWNLSDASTEELIKQLEHRGYNVEYKSSLLNKQNI